MFYRLRIVGLTYDNTCDMPITQTELSDATGISAVHINRTLQELRTRNLIVLRGKILTIPDLAALQRIALFKANYLHLDREGAHLDASDE
jgi:transcription initiation factor IIE alpha subunit